MSALLLALVLAAAPPARHAPAAHDDKRPTMYVDDIAAPADLASTASSLTSGLCTALAKDGRIDVSCAPDVKQILEFAATSSLVGTGSTATEKVQARLDRVAVVVSGVLKREGKGLVLVVRAGPRSAESGGTSLTASEAQLSLEERADAAPLLLPRVTSLATRIAARMAPAAASLPVPPKLEH